MSIWTEVKAFWHVYAVPLFKGPQEPEEESAEEWLARKFPVESEWEELGPYQFGDKVYIETRKDEEGMYLVLDQTGEDVTIIDRHKRVKNINGSFVCPWEGVE